MNLGYFDALCSLCNDKLGSEEQMLEDTVVF